MRPMTSILNVRLHLVTVFVNLWARSRNCETNFSQAGRWRVWKAGRPFLTQRLKSSIKVQLSLRPISTPKLALAGDQIHEEAILVGFRMACFQHRTAAPSNRLDLFKPETLQSDRDSHSHSAL
jgi:hypothetical protein